jgi:hypothetical protein
VSVNQSVIVIATVSVSGKLRNPGEIEIESLK